MTQTLRYWIEDTEYERDLPDPDTELLPGVNWGEPWTMFTPAYWVSQFWMTGLEYADRSPYRAHDTLAGELAFCLLGGFGVNAELATAAFEACRTTGLIARLESNPNAWSTVLREPLIVKGRTRRYRYPNQKARFLAGAMAYLYVNPPGSLSGRALRDELLNIDGVGLKTAGWVARNYADADDVAILDIHLVRAGLLCGLFSPSQKVERDYFDMERRFIEFCAAVGARPAVLDCLIWDQMRAYGRVALDALASRFGKPRQATVG